MKKKNKKYLDDDETIEDVSFKGTPFHKCDIPYDVFNIGRRTKIFIKQQLSRVGFLVLRDGTIEVKDPSEKKPDLSNSVSAIEDMAV